MKDMRSKAVIVLVNSSTGAFSELPQPVRQEIAKPEMGSMTPRMTVFDKHSEKALGSLSYKQLSDKKATRGLDNAIREYAKNGAVAGDDEAGDNDGSEETSKLGKDGKISDSDLTEWTSAKGTKMKARATRYADGKLTLVRENGTSLKVSLEQLSAESRKTAEELIGK